MFSNSVNKSLHIDIFFIKKPIILLLSTLHYMFSANKYYLKMFYLSINSLTKLSILLLS